MAQTQIAAVMRAGAFSPNHIGNDATIMNAVAEQLRKRGCEVRVYSEEQLCAGEVKEDVVINMCRERRSMERLQQMESAEGRLIINSGYGIENCIRERQARILSGCGIEYPESVIVDTDESVLQRLEKVGMSRCWIKRGDFHSQHAEDVSYVRSAVEAQDVLAEYFLRGFHRAVICRHLPGKLVKFYAVEGSDFFQWFMPFEAEEQGDEQFPREEFEQRLKTLCNRAAHEIGLVVYGGECILGPQGELHIIDLNDWPSFSSCRAEASKAIAKVVMAKVKQWRREREEGSQASGVRPRGTSKLKATRE